MSRIRSRSDVRLRSAASDQRFQESFSGHRERKHVRVDPALSTNLRPECRVGNAPGAWDKKERFTAKNLARRADQKNPNISRKDAKAAKKKKQYLSELGVLRALAGGISESEMFEGIGKFASVAKTFKHSSASRGGFETHPYMCSVRSLR